MNARRAIGFSISLFPPYTHWRSIIEKYIRHIRDRALQRMQNIRGIKVRGALVPPGDYILHELLFEINRRLHLNVTPLELPGEAHMQSLLPFGCGLSIFNTRHHKAMEVINTCAIYLGTSHYFPVLPQRCVNTEPVSCCFQARVRFWRPATSSGSRRNPTSHFRRQRTVRDPTRRHNR